VPKLPCALGALILSGSHTVALATGAMVTASSAGAHLDADLMKGGGTDDTAILQTVLDRASDGRPVHLVIDGVARVGGLNVYGNTTIECVDGGGLYLKDGSGRAIIRNVHRSREAVTDQHITVRGCFLNGNREHQQGELRRLDAQLNQESVETGQANQEADGTFITGLQFLGVNYLTIENTVLWNIRAFGAWIANAKFIDIRNVQVDDGNSLHEQSETTKETLKQWEKYVNTDGIHFNGPIQYLTIDGLKLRTSDDALALNANDAGHDDITAGNVMGPYVGQGPITDVTVSNVVLMDPVFGIRMLSSNQRIDRIVINNVTGTIRYRMAILGHYTATRQKGNFGSIAFNNVNVDPLRIPSYSELLEAASEAVRKWIEQHKQELADELESPLFSLNSVIENLSLSRVVTHAIDDRPLIRVGSDAKIQILDVDLICRDPALRATPLKFVAGGHVSRLNLALKWSVE
jgi:hypothetical protein